MSNSNLLSQNKINSTVKRILSSSPEIKEKGPSIISQKPVLAFQVMTDDYFLLAILDKDTMKRVKEFLKRKIDPFPGLIAPNDVKGVAIRLEKSKYGYFTGNHVNNLYSFSLGKDCTFILMDHHVSINIKNIGHIEYVIDLAYIISFGEEINYKNVYSYLNELVTYTLKQWGDGNGVII